MVMFQIKMAITVNELWSAIVAKGVKFSNDSDWLMITK